MKAPLSDMQREVLREILALAARAEQIGSEPDLTPAPYYSPWAKIGRMETCAALIQDKLNVWFREELQHTEGTPQ